MQCCWSLSNKAHKFASVRVVARIRTGAPHQLSARQLVKLGKQHGHIATLMRGGREEAARYQRQVAQLLMRPHSTPTLLGQLHTPRREQPRAG